MIYPEELRLGNYVLDRGKKIIRIDFFESLESKSCSKFGQRMFNDDYELHPLTEYTDYAEPIKLSVVWLGWLGFRVNAYQDRYEKRIARGEEMLKVEYKAYEQTTTKDGRILESGVDLWIEGMPHIKYVHQLQNLYYAITGEELSIDKIHQKSFNFFSQLTQKNDT